LAQSLGFFFYSLLKCLKRFIALLPDAAVPEDLRTRAGLSPSYNAIASGRHFRFRQYRAALSLNIHPGLLHVSINL
jgi:hypothetical protein